MDSGADVDRGLLLSHRLQRTAGTDTGDTGRAELDILGCTDTMDSNHSIQHLVRPILYRR